MARRMDALRRRGSSERFSFDDLAAQIAGLNGWGAMRPVTTWDGGATEVPPSSFEGHCQAAYKANGIVFSVIYARMRLFSEARFAWRDWTNGKPGSLYTNPSLDILQRPWPNGTTRDLLCRMEQDGSLAGNSYTVNRGRSLRRLRPALVDIVVTSPNNDPFDIDAEVFGYIFHPDGRGSKRAKPVSLLAAQVGHYAPVPDPEARFRGMSWLSPVVEEITADKATTLHKRKFFDNAATPNLAVKMPITDKKAFLEAVAAMDETHKGASNAYKTMWLMGGADVSVVGANMEQLDFKVTQGAGETRIAAAGGVPPIIVGLSEGLQAATYSNYGQARRAFADLWARPAWGSAATTLESILDRPRPNSELWYSEDGISFLQEDQKDAAEILSRRMATIESGVRAGFKPETVVSAVDADDLTQMQHTGLYSVQLQPPGANTPGRAAVIDADTHEVVRYIDLPPTP